MRQMMHNNTIRPNLRANDNNLKCWRMHLYTMHGL